MSNNKIDKETKEIIENFPHSGKQYLIPLLQEIQVKDGHISDTAMDLVAKKIDVPVARVYGVITFYSFFRTKPIGKNLLKPCRGTACHVKGAKGIINKIKDKLELGNLDTTADNKFTLSPIACMGACGLAPVLMVGETVYGNLDEDKVGKIIDRLKK